MSNSSNYTKDVVVFFGRIYKKRYQNGDIVYLAKDGIYTEMVKMDIPYKVLNCQPKTEAMMDLYINGEGVPDRGITVNSDDFISEEEYLKTKKNDEVETPQTPTSNVEYINSLVDRVLPLMNEVDKLFPKELNIYSQLTHLPLYY